MLSCQKAAEAAEEGEGEVKEEVVEVACSDLCNTR